MESVDTQFLISAGWSIPTPFRMTVPKPGCGPVEIECVQIYRLLPGKRIVMLARDQGEPILVKAFLGRNANRNAAREVRGIEAIAKAGVCTPELLWMAEIPGSGRMLALHFLPDAVSLFHQWDQADNVAERIEILSSVMQIMSRLHQSGVIQKDIHLANFLLSNDKFHMIDGGGIQRKYSVSASEDTSLLNLANFFAQFLARNDDLVPSVLKVYEQARGWTSDAQGVSEYRRLKLSAEITRCRKIRKRNHIGKSLRNCTRFVCQSSFRRFMVCERSAYDNELQGLLRHPDRFIADGKLLKNGNSATVALVHLSDRPLVIKRYNIKGILHGARRLFRKSRARVSWSNAWHMEFLGIPALKPVAMIENRIGPFRTSAYLITEYIEGPDALHCLREMADPKGEPEALAQIIQKLSESWISHGDLKATNFLMARYGPVIIDLDAMQEHKNQNTFRRAFRNDLKRFMANWEDYPALSDRFMGLLSDLDKRHGKQTDLVRN